MTLRMSVSLRQAACHGEGGGTIDLRRKAFCRQLTQSQKFQKFNSYVQKRKCEDVTAKSEIAFLCLERSKASLSLHDFLVKPATLSSNDQFLQLISSC